MTPRFTAHNAGKDRKVIEVHESLFRGFMKQPGHRPAYRTTNFYKKGQWFVFEMTENDQNSQKIA